MRDPVKPLDWTRPNPRLWVASCGSEGQGKVTISLRPEGAYRWVVDMLPGTAEPAIGGQAEALEDAQYAAARQVAAWPGVIVGARRHG